MTERERIVSVLKRKKPDRVPWATRLDIWHKSALITGRLPEAYRDIDVMKIYEDLGIGRESYFNISKYKLNGVELTVELNGETTHREDSPELGRFPKAASYVSQEEPGETVLFFKTPAGTASVVFKTTETLLRGGAAPYCAKHFLEDEADRSAVEWILDHAEPVANFDEFSKREKEVGDQGLVIGYMERIPFQSLLLDYFGEERCYFEIYDNPDRFEALLDRVAALYDAHLAVALDSPALMLESGDNFDGQMTNPNLFKQYCIPKMQQISDRVHSKGKVIGSHMDGDMRNLLSLVPETGYDVVESFSQEPLSSLTFQEAWDSWGDKILMWGALPSPLFEEGTSEDQFDRAVEHVLKAVVPDGLIILGIADQAVEKSRVSRIRRAGELIEQRGYYS
jgi:uroporphyrinogen-III decarboxylase